MRCQAFDASKKTNHPLCLGLTFALALATTIGITGCSDLGVELHPVSGKILFKGGEPVTSGVIEFSPVGKGPAARAKIQSNGEFTLTTGNQPGAVADLHQIVIVQLVVSDTPHKHQHNPPKTIHKKYARFETSGLEKSVKANENNEFKIEVDPAE